MFLTNPRKNIIKSISPYLILVISLSLILSLLDALSMFIFSDAINKTFTGSSMGINIGASIIDISRLSIKEMFGLYMSLFLLTVVLNWLVTYFSNRVGVILFKKIHSSIMAGELKSFQEEAVSHYQVLLFEEVRNVQERFFVALSVVIHRSIFVVFSFIMFINITDIEVFTNIPDLSGSYIIALFLFAFIFTIYKITKTLGERSLKENKKRYQITTHGFWQWRWTRIRGQENKLVLSVQKSGDLIAKFLSTVTTIGLSFKNILEIIIFILVLANYETLTLSDSINSGVLVFGGVLLFRIMPAMSGILNNLVGVSSSISSFRFVINAIDKYGVDTNTNTNTNTNTIAKAHDFDTACYFRVNNIHYSVGRKSLFENYSLCIPKTGIVVISGESGSGKSTLLNILLGFVEPDGGSVIFDDTQLSRSTRGRLWTCVGLVEQDYNNIFGTVSDAMSEVNVSKKRFENILKNVFNLQDDLDMAAFMKQTIQSLSGGERQRIAFLRVYFLSPPILALDEYGSGLDERTLGIFKDLCIEYAQNNLVIWVSHIDSVKQSATKLVNLDEK